MKGAERGMSMQSRSRKPPNRIVLAALLTGLALALSLVDTAVSAAIPFLPGFKLGIANIVTMFALYYLGFREALVINVIRCLLSALLSGFVTMLFFSIAGALLSLVVMALLMNRISRIKVSVTGGIAHNMAQAAVAAALTATPQVSYYIPFLVISGAISGFFIGLLCSLLMQRLHAGENKSL